MPADSYQPINTLKPVADNVWIVDGPIIRFGYAFLKFPFPTRMTIVRLANGDLFVHSPTPLPANLKCEVDNIGTPRWIIGPNRIHYWWIPDWHAAYPDAAVYLAPRIKEQSRGRIDFETRPLTGDRGYPWDLDIATLAFAGDYLTEFAFFHRHSRTLVLTDLIENFEPRKLHVLWLRLLARLGGVLDPDGKTPRDLLMTFKDKVDFRRRVETLIAWDPERVIIAHGRWYRSDGTRELRRAFRRVLS